MFTGLVEEKGTITAVEHRVVLDGGAYTSYGVITAYYAGSMLPTLYKIPNYVYHGTRVYTNLPASGVKTSIGTGLRYETLVGPIRLDWGYKLNREPGDSPWRFHLTIGYPF